MELKPYKSKECMSALKGGLIAVKLCCGFFLLNLSALPLLHTYIHTHTPFSAYCALVKASLQR